MKKPAAIFVILVFWLASQAQDPHFSQFYSNYLYLAPSFSGLSVKNRIGINYRNQWPEIKTGYQTYSVSFDKYFEKFRSGLGALIFQDVAGTGMLRTTQIGLQYSYDFAITRQWSMRPGMHFSYSQRTVDFDKLLWNDQISASGNASTTAELYPVDKTGDIDFSVSLLSYSERFWIGACVDHLLRPNQSFYYYEEEEGNPGKVPLKYSVFGGIKFIKNEHLLRPIPTSIHIAFLFRQQEQFRQLDMGVYWYRSPIIMGFWYRGIPMYKEVFNRDAFTSLIGIKTNNISIGYSYDFTISRLVTHTGGAHEISIAYAFKTKPIERKPRQLPCPDF
ncbi:MAG: type IX secretion system membrane protein PorP/SprF [Bacteroidales bacterium]|nr:type IX secretion system membrane protein PorP/SprF [Bacteroidales bacterium]